MKLEELNQYTSKTECKKCGGGVKAAEWDYSKNPPKAIWVCNNCGDETPRQIRDRNK